MHYTGDINLQYGGMFLDLEEFKRWGDFCPVLKVTDLDSACGFESAVLIERGSIYIPENVEKRESALSCIGIEKGESYTDLQLIVAFDAYHGIECDSFAGEIILILDKEADSEFEGWKADLDYSKQFWDSGLSLKEWLEQEFLT